MSIKKSLIAVAIIWVIAIFIGLIPRFTAKEDDFDEYYKVS